MATKNKLTRWCGRVSNATLLLLLAANLSFAAEKSIARTPTQSIDEIRAARKQVAAQKLLRGRVLGARPLRMFYYFDDTRGFESLQSHASGITVLAPQCFPIDGDGFIHGALPPRALAAARDAKLAIMPLVFNQGFDRPTVTALLHSKAAQERAVEYIGYLAKRDNVVGFQIDLENIDPADQRLFSQFVKRAAARLHYNGRLLSVAVTPRFSDAGPGTHRRGEIPAGEWSAAFDYRALSRYADFITLMTYDHSVRTGPPGPIAGYGWVKSALRYAVRRVPRSKLLLGVPLYGREWTANDDEGSASRSLTSKDVRELIERPEVIVQWNAKWRSPWFEYNDGSALRTVWFEDTRSLKEKISLMRQYQLRGFAAWRLGDEGAEFWPLADEEKTPQTRAQLRQSHPAASKKRRAKTQPQKTRRLNSQVRTKERAHQTGR